MLTLETVDIEDVYPYERADGESMNPRDFSTRESAEHIERLAEQFRLNRLNPGQPVMKPILYRDGGIYWIIDGECRVRAMKAIGTKRFLAEVYDDLDDAETARRESAKAMVETDQKLRLSAAEMSRGVQQMLALDVPEEEVSTASGIEVEKVRRARRGARAAEDDAYDMTLDRLYAIAEFVGDQEAVAKLRDCPQKDWRRVYDGLTRERERREAEGELADICEGAGIGRIPDDGTPRVSVAQVSIGQAGAADRVRSALGDATGYDIDGNWFELLREETDADREERERGLREREGASVRRQRAAELWDAETASALAWIGERIGGPRSMRRTASALCRRAEESIGGTLAALGAEVDMSPTPALVAVGLDATWLPDRYAAQDLAEGRYLPWQVRDERAAPAGALAAAMEADGYAFGETGAAVLGTLRKHMEEQ